MRFPRLHAVSLALILALPIAVLMAATAQAGASLFPSASGAKEAPVPLIVTAAVSMQDYSFSPQTITITAGTTVTWTNVGKAPHTTTNNTTAPTWDSGTVSPGQSFSRTFDTPGTFPYVCVFHQTFGMIGTVVVLAATPTPTSTPTRTPTVVPISTFTPTLAPTDTPLPAPQPTPVPTATQSPTTTPTPTDTPAPIPTPPPAETPTPTATLTVAATLTPTDAPTAAPTATPAPTATLAPLSTPTPLPGSTGQLAGRVLLQGRSNHAGVTASIADKEATTATDGSYSIVGITPGVYTLRVLMNGYLRAERLGVGVETGRLTPLPEVTLLAGDANGDGIVDTSDLMIEAATFSRQPSSSSWDLRGDIDGDGQVDIHDLALTGGNFGSRAPSPWQ
ncbi:MAG: cupredoxin domain-containing protein [Chloroflexi bacterium]|nr:cupredoxin domain-containing protein [Chloroflexota bacterium]